MLRSRLLAVCLCCAGSLALGAASASAQSYQVLLGSLTDAATGETSTLSGSFETSLSPLAAPGLSTVLLVDDFDFQAGGQSFTSRGPIEFDGLEPTLVIQIADQIHVTGDAVSFLRLHGGGVLESSDSEVTFRTFEFRGTQSDGGEAIGLLGNGPQPRRLELAGTLFQVDQTFEIQDSCTPTVPGIPGDGGVVISGGTIIEYSEFDITPQETIEFVQPGGSSRVLNRLDSGSPSTIDGALISNGSVYIVNPAGLILGPGSVTTVPPGPLDPPSRVPDGPRSEATTPLATELDGPPTLEELGITATGDVEVSLQNGLLSITSQGDLSIGDIDWAFPGVTEILIQTTGSITVEGSIDLPSDVSLTIEAGGDVVIDDGSDPGDIIIGEPLPFPRLCGLRLVATETTEVGAFEIVATAATPVDVDVRPDKKSNRVKPGTRQRIPVAVLGSADLDVDTIDDASLRLGRGEAFPLLGRGYRQRVDRDPFTDLLAFFKAKDAEIAFGDTHVCITGETFDGEVFEGCDAIETTPRR